MKTAKLLINWYKPSGKWYAGQHMYVPNDIETFDNQHIDFIEQYQKELQQTFVDTKIIMTVSCIEQDDKDMRFFERLVKYPRSKL